MRLGRGKSLPKREMIFNVCNLLIRYNRSRVHGISNPVYVLNRNVQIHIITTMSKDIKPPVRRFFF